MAWGAQIHNKRTPTNPRHWGAQTKPCRGEVVKRTEDGEVFPGTRSFGRKGEKVNRRR
jgi:hypothetical protein